MRSALAIRSEKARSETARQEKNKERSRTLLASEERLARPFYASPDALRGRALGHDKSFRGHCKATGLARVSESGNFSAGEGEQAVQRSYPGLSSVFEAPSLPPCDSVTDCHGMQCSASARETSECHQASA